jgi:hypothetical protein
MEDSMVKNNTTCTSTAIADSGCIGHFLQVTSPCLNKTPTNNGLRVLLPDGSTIQATHTALLDMPNRPIAGRQAHIFPQLKHNALISISHFPILRSRMHSPLHVHRPPNSGKLQAYHSGLPATNHGTVDH